MPDLGNTVYRIDLSTVRSVHIDDSDEMVLVTPGTFRIGYPGFILNGETESKWHLGDEAELWYFFTANTATQPQWAGPVRQIRGLVHDTDN